MNLFFVISEFLKGLWKNNWIIKFETWIHDDFSHSYFITGSSMLLRFSAPLSQLFIAASFDDVLCICKNKPSLWK